MTNCILWKNSAYVGDWSRYTGGGGATLSTLIGCTVAFNSAYQGAPGIAGYPSDFGGDHMNNFGEWRCQTDPTNPAALLRLFAPVKTSTKLLVTWQSIPSTTYFVECSAGAAASISFEPIGTNIIAQGILTLGNPNPPPNWATLYRVGVK